MEVNVGNQAAESNDLTKINITLGLRYECVNVLLGCLHPYNGLSEIILVCAPGD